MAATVAIAWTNAETKALLTIWDTEFVQKLLAKATRNKHIYETFPRS